MDQERLENDLESALAEIERLERRLAAAKEGLGKLAGFIQPNQLVWYEASPGKRFAAVVDGLPREMGSGQWCVRLRELGEDYQKYNANSHTTVSAAATWCLSPRETGVPVPNLPQPDGELYKGMFSARVMGEPIPHLPSTGTWTSEDGSDAIGVTIRGCPTHTQGPHETCPVCDQVTVAAARAIKKAQALLSEPQPGWNSTREPRSTAELVDAHWNQLDDAVRAVAPPLINEMTGSLTTVLGAEGLDATGRVGGFIKTTLSSFTARLALAIYQRIAPKPTMAEKPTHRLALARERAGLSIGQAAKLLTWDPDTLRAVESAPEIPAATVVELASLYRVKISWMLGESPLRDYETVDAMRGAENLTPHDRDVIAEFAASLPGGTRNPFKKED